MQNGKIPPQAIDLEEAVIGAMILEQDCILRIIDIISPKSFYKSIHRVIADSIFEMINKNQNIDILTLSNFLKTKNQLNEIGGMYHLTSLTNKISTTVNIENYAKIIQEKYLAREVIRFSSQLNRSAYEDSTDVFDLIDNALLAFSKLTGFNKSNIRHISESIKSLQQLIDKNLNHNNQITGTATGLTEFDKFSNGLQNTDLVVIAGEPSNGKTALALEIVAYAAKNKTKCAIYSYEMSDRQLAARMIAGEAKVSGKTIQYYPLSEIQLEKVNRGIADIENTPIYIDEMESSRFDYLERSIRSMVINEGIELIVIDYLQLIQPNDSRKNKTDAIAEIANDIKRLARTLKIKIILLSQLSRDKLNPKPVLGRLKGSGDIENAADVVWFVWLPYKYDYQNFECKMQTYQADGLAHNIIAKGRNIGTTEFVTQFDGSITKFSDYVLGFVNQESEDVY